MGHVENVVTDVVLIMLYWKITSRGGGRRGRRRMRRGRREAEAGRRGINTRSKEVRDVTSLISPYYYTHCL